MEPDPLCTPFLKEKMVGSSIFQLLLSAFFLCFFLQHPAHALKKSYIVYLGSHSHGQNPSSADLDSATNSHYNLLGSLLGSHEKAKEAIFYNYKRHINGFAAVLEEEEAAELAKNPNVVSVFLNKVKKLRTTRSWQFLGLEKNGTIPKDSIWEKARYGEDTIIGSIDTGVWPESKSFSDEGYGPVPSRWRGRGICQLGTYNNSHKVLCNRKLIEARFFIKGYEAEAGGKFNASLYTARDTQGHGTHTLSTAGGNFVPGASVFGFGSGTAKGGSPKARVAAYKVCWPPLKITDGGCYDADVLAGFEAAISDGVDVISVSIGGSPINMFEDPIAIGSFHAIANGIVVVASAGNDGPDPGTVSNIAPWIFTVAASTIDREFSNYVGLGDKKHIKGASLSAKGLPKFHALVSAEDAKLPEVLPEQAKLCLSGTLDPNKVKGKILVCLRGEINRIEKGRQASQAGAVGMILANDLSNGNEIEADAYVLPASHVNYSDGEYIYSYIKRTKNPGATMTKLTTELGTKPAPYIAVFSSRGPNTIIPTIIKPDITAPGVNIIASYTGASSPTDPTPGKLQVPFYLMSGTSMACPHVSGIVGLLKTFHPDWSPAAIRSAIMTTATTLDNSNRHISDSNLTEEATPWCYGAGHIQPDLALDPGLVYDLNTTDYLNFLCAIGYNKSGVLKLFYSKPFTCPESYSVADFNYPSITVPRLGLSPVNISRTVTNVGPPSTYYVDAKVPAGLEIVVQPSYLRFTKTGEKKTFHVLLQPAGWPKNQDTLFGELLWTNGKQRVKSPIAVTRVKF